MNVSVCCDQERRADGSYHLTPRPGTTSFVLAGSAARLWELLVEVAQRPVDEQESLLGDVAGAAQPRVISMLARLERAGAIEVCTRGGARAFGRRPRTLHLEVTQRCNFACRACYLGPALLPVRAPQAAGEATAERWAEVIDEAAHLGCEAAIVTGGEPFVRRDVIEIVAALRRRSIRTEINTNAACITSAVARALFEMGVWGVEVSLYGYDAASAAGYTGRPGGYQASLRGVRRLCEQGVPVQVKYFATAATLDGFERVRAELAALGVPVICKGHAIHADVFAGRAPAQGVRSALEVPELVQEGGLPCGPGIEGLVIEPDGEVRPCPKLGVRLGNVFRDGLAGVWESDAMRSFEPFWARYCADEGFVRGARLRNRCPAAALLSRSGGLQQFRARWAGWGAEVGA